MKKMISTMNGWSWADEKKAWAKKEPLKIKKNWKENICEWKKIIFSLHFSNLHKIISIKEYIFSPANDIL